MRGRCLRPQLHAGSGKVGTPPLFRRLDLEELVEARVAEDVPQVFADAGQAELAARGEQALLGLEQDAQARARDVLQALAVQRDRSLDLVEKGLSCRRLRGIE